MNNNLEALNNALFEAIERIQDDELSEEDLNKEIRRAVAVTNVANTIIQNGELALKAMHLQCEYGTADGSKVLTPRMLEVSR